MGCSEEGGEGEVMRYNRATIQIPIGSEILSGGARTGRTVYLPMRVWGTTLVVALPRWGKSALAKSLVVRISKKRPVMIFDVNSEWADHITRFNRKSRDSMRMTDVRVYENIVQKISEYTRASDWFSMGFSTDACSAIAAVARHAGVHKDDPNIFSKMLDELPTSAKERVEFSNNWGFVAPILFKMTKISVIAHFGSIIEWFWFVGDKRNWYDWEAEFLEKWNMIVDVGMGFGRSTNVPRARALTGNILSRIKRYYKVKKPLLVFEEIRLLAPALGPGKEFEHMIPSSLLEIRDLVTLLPKCDVAVLAIMQNEEQVDKELVKNAHTKILGAVGDGEGKEYQLASSLRWDPDRGYREGLLYQEHGVYSRFVPFLSVCGS